jgi:hypothetical protein
MSRRITIIDAGNGFEEQFGVETTELAAAIVKLGWTVLDDELEEPEAKESELVHYEEDEEGVLSIPLGYEADKYIELCSALVEIDCDTIRAARLLSVKRKSSEDSTWSDTLPEERKEAARSLQESLCDADTMTYNHRYGGFWNISSGLSAAIAAAGSRV